MTTQYTYAVIVDGNVQNNGAQFARVGSAKDMLAYVNAQTESGASTSIYKMAATPEYKSKEDLDPIQLDAFKGTIETLKGEALAEIESLGLPVSVDQAKETAAGLLEEAKSKGMMAGMAMAGVAMAFLQNGKKDEAIENGKKILQQHAAEVVGQATSKVEEVKSAAEGLVVKGRDTLTGAFEERRDNLTNTSMLEGFQDDEGQRFVSISWLVLGDNASQIKASTLSAHVKKAPVKRPSPKK